MRGHLLQSLVGAAILTLLATGLSGGQTAVEAARARTEYRAGLDHMRAEAWERAVRAFDEAIRIDATFDLAYYMLGRAHMALKRYPEAVSAYVRCRDLYLAQAGRTFSNAQDAQRARNDRITLIDELIRQMLGGPQTIQSQNQLRQLQDQRRQIQDSLSRGNNLSIDATVPAYVSLALGSAYFRLGRLADAEREYKATIAADSKTGEAHSNLAVVYLQTGRYSEAEKAVKAAEKVGFRVNPMLKDEIADKKSESK